MAYTYIVHVHAFIEVNPLWTKHLTTFYMYMYVFMLLQKLLYLHVLYMYVYMYMYHPGINQG